MSRRRRRPSRAGVHLPWDEVFPTLDLHGYTAEEATRRARGWLEEQQAHAARTVRVITGRGNRSPGLPVLRGEIEGLLHSLRGTVVAAYAPESGGGAFRVELRKRSRPPAPRPSAARARSAPDAPLDPDLRRRAEDALWELGIQPTPELIRAQLRRMREQAGDGNP